MKNIKFKVWDKKGKKWIPDYQLIINTQGKLCCCYSDKTFGEWKIDYKVVLFTGFKLKGRELYTKDVIQFSYKDKIEIIGYGYCTGVIEFENGAFVVKEISFKHYDWKNEDQRPILLYDWLRNHRCKYLGNVLESKELLKL